MTIKITIETESEKVVFSANSIKLASRALHSVALLSDVSESISEFMSSMCECLQKAQVKDNGEAAFEVEQ